MSGATSYHVTYTDNNAESWQLAALDHTDTTITITADNDKSYIVGVRAKNGAGGSNWVNSGLIGPYVAPPNTPEELEAKGNSNGSATITWKNPNDASITGYQYQQQEQGGEWGENKEIQGSGAGTTSHTITGLTSGATYNYSLQALNTGGASGKRTVSVTIPARLDGPATVTITSRPTGQVVASWTEVPGAYSYHIYTSDSSNWNHFTSRKINKEDNNGDLSTSVTLTGMQDNLTYTVLVSAATTFGHTILTESYPVGTSTSPPVMPESVSLSRTSGTSLTATWASVAGASTYESEISADGGKNWTRWATGLTTPSYSGSVLSDRDYFVRVRTVNAQGNSPWRWSEEDKALAAPSNLTIGSRIDNSMVASWDAVAGATGYNVQTSDDNGRNWDDQSHTGITRNATITIDAGKDYLVRVRAVKDSKTSNWTAPVASKAELLAPASVSAIRGSNSTGDYGSITLAWSAVTGATSYEIACSVFGGNFWHVCKTVTASDPIAFTEVYNRTAKRYNPVLNARDFVFAIRAKIESGNRNSTSDWARITVWPDDSGQNNATAVIHAGNQTGTWYYKQTTPSGPACQTVSSGSVAFIENLNEGTEHTYGLYTDSGCNTANNGRPNGAITFTTPALTIGDVNADANTATLTFAERSTQWYVKSDASNASCENAGTGSTYSLTGLTASEDFTYTAYSDSACTSANELASLSFSIPITLTASSVTSDSATLTITRHTGNWYVKETGPATNATCSSAISGGTHSLSTLTAGTSYTYKAYSDSGCTTEIASTTFSTRSDYDADNDRLIEITTLAQLNAVRWDLDGNGQVTGINQTNYRSAFPDAVGYTGATAMGCPSTGCQGYELSNDLDFDTNGSNTNDSGDTYWNSGSGWEPIGDDTTPYTGHFDGGTYEIDNLFIDRVSPLDLFIGLFGVLGPAADIKNVALTNVDIDGEGTGGMSSSTSVYAGALAGKNMGEISGSRSTGSITTERANSALADAQSGGLVGSNKGTAASGNTPADIASITNSYSTAAVSATANGRSESYAGGLVAYNHDDALIETSYATGAVTVARDSGTNSVLLGGGLAGANHGGEIKASYATGDVDGTGDYIEVGGLVGVNSGSIMVSYSTGDVDGNGSDVHAGGLVGQNQTSGTIDSAYSTGTPTGTQSSGTPDVGGSIGESSAGSNALRIYWDVTTTGIADDADNNAPEGKTTTDLQTPTDYTGIYSDWNIDLDGVTGNDDPWDFGTASQYPVIDYGALTASGQRP